ncbi:uncharacterized protein LOC108590293 [Callithrix jacchus]
MVVRPPRKCGTDLTDTGVIRSYLCFTTIPLAALWKTDWRMAKTGSKETSEEAAIIPEVNIYWRDLYLEKNWFCGEPESIHARNHYKRLYKNHGTSICF